MFRKETMSPYIDTHAQKNLYVLHTHIYSHIYMHIFMSVYIVHIYVCMCVYVLSFFHSPVHTSIDLFRYFPTHNILKKIRQDQSIIEIQSPKDPQRSFKNKECFSQRRKSPRQYQQKELSWNLIPMSQLQVQLPSPHTTLSFAQIFGIQMDRY